MFLPKKHSRYFAKTPWFRRASRHPRTPHRRGSRRDVAFAFSVPTRAKSSIAVGVDREIETRSRRQTGAKHSYYFRPTNTVYFVDYMFRRAAPSLPPAGVNTCLPGGHVYAKNKRSPERSHVSPLAGRINREIRRDRCAIYEAATMKIFSTPFPSPSRVLFRVRNSPAEYYTAFDISRSLR